MPTSPPTPARQRVSHGFTMTELLVVIGIIAILATMLMAGFVRMQQNTKLVALTDRVISHLQTARAMAINSGRVYRFEIKAYAMQESFYSMWILSDSTPNPLERLPVQKGLNVLDDAAEQEFIVAFNPDGSSGGTTEIHIQDPATDTIRTVQVFQGGMIRLKRGN